MSYNCLCQIEAIAVVSRKILHRLYNSNSLENYNADHTSVADLMVSYNINHDKTWNNNSISYLSIQITACKPASPVTTMTIKQINQKFCIV